MEQIDKLINLADQYKKIACGNEMQIGEVEIYFTDANELSINFANTVEIWHWTERRNQIDVNISDYDRFKKNIDYIIADCETYLKNLKNDLSSHNG